MIGNRDQLKGNQDISCCFCFRPFQTKDTVCMCVCVHIYIYVYLRAGKPLTTYLKSPNSFANFSWTML